MHHSSYQLRDRVAGHTVDLVIGAPSETLRGMGRLARGRQIRDCARQHEASHCFLQGDVAYFSDRAGLCLAAQIERLGSPFHAFGQRYLLCAPFDQMVYLCHWDEGLVRDERAVTVERAREALAASSVPVVMAPVGQLAAQLGDVGAASSVAPSALLLHGAAARSYRYRRVLGCLLAHGLPVAAHAWLATAAIAAALVVGYAAPWLLGRSADSARGQSLVKHGQRLAVSALFPVAAASDIRDVNQLGSRIAPWAVSLGVRALRIEGGAALVSGNRARAVYRRRHADALGFEEASREGEAFRWRHRLMPRRHARRAPLSAAELAALLERLAPGGWQWSEQRRRATDYGFMSHVRLRADSAIHYLLAELAALFEGVPARLVKAEMHFDQRGRSTRAELLLAIPMLGQRL